MKKITSLLMAVLMLITVIPFTAIPAFAAGEPTEITVDNSEITIAGNCIIKEAGEYEVEQLLVKPSAKLTIGEGVTIKVINFYNLGTIEVLGTLDLSQIRGQIRGEVGIDSITVGDTGELIYTSQQEITSLLEPSPEIDDTHQFTNGGSTLSEGSLTIIVGVAAAVVFGLGGFILGTKKKKKTE